MKLLFWKTFDYSAIALLIFWRGNRLAKEGQLLLRSDKNDQTEFWLYMFLVFQELIMIAALVCLVLWYRGYSIRNQIRESGEILEGKISKIEKTSAEVMTQFGPLELKGEKKDFYQNLSIGQNIKIKVKSSISNNLAVFASQGER